MSNMSMHNGQMQGALVAHLHFALEGNTPAVGIVPLEIRVKGQQYIDDRLRAQQSAISDEGTQPRSTWNLSVSNVIKPKCK